MTQRVMGDLGLGPNEVKGYEAYLEGRVLELGSKQGRRELNEQWKRIRRGWYLGGDEFQSRLLQRVKRTVSQGLAASYSGAAKRAHGEREAARMLGKAALGLRAEGPRAQEPAGEAVLAWWLRQRTTVSRRDQPAAGDGGRIRGDAGSAKGEDRPRRQTEAKAATIAERGGGMVLCAPRGSPLVMMHLPVCRD